MVDFLSKVQKNTAVQQIISHIKRDIIFDLATRQAIVRIPPII
jgi:hypothetical protein